MFITSHYLLSVVCLTIVTSTRSLPTKNVSDEISGALSCAFLRKYTNDTKRYCSEVDFDHYDDKFNRMNYACMELYDVSLQLCDIKDANSDFGIVPKATDFCKELKFYPKRAESIEPLASTAVKFLSTSANCDKVCISDKAIHPICEAIYLGNKFLIKTAEDRQAESSRKPVEHTDVSDTTHSQSNPTTPKIQSSLQRDQPRHDKDLMIPITPKHEKPKDSKEERKSDPENSMAVESQVKDIPSMRIADSARKSDDLTRRITGKKGDLENIRSEDALQTAEDKPIQDKHVDDLKSFASVPQLPEHIENVIQNSEEQLPKVSHSLAPADAVPSVTPANPESFYKDSADDREDFRESSKDGEIDTEGIGDGSFKDDAGSSNVAQEDSPNIYASGEPEESLGITGNKYSSRFPHAQDSHFFAYFLTMVVLCIIGYLVFHNKQKIIALALEGRRMQGSRRRPNTSSYKKLDSNLEEAVTSNCSSSSVTHVIF